MSKDKKPFYRVIFLNNGKTFEVYATRVNQGAIYGFVEIEGLLFNERSGLVVDPSEEKLKAEFDGVKRTSIPFQSIVRIDEVEKQGVAKISDVKGEVIAAFPLSQPEKNPV